MFKSSHPDQCMYIYLQHTCVEKKPNLLTTMYVRKEGSVVCVQGKCTQACNQTNVFTTSCGIQNTRFMCHHRDYEETQGFFEMSFPCFTQEKTTRCMIGVRPTGLCI